MNIDWDLPKPNIVDIHVTELDIDHFGHTNNAVYVQWMEKAAWAHSNNVGITWDVYRAHNCGPVVMRHELDYIKPTYLGEHIQVATWVTGHQRRLRTWRQYQAVRVADNVTVMRGLSAFIWVNIENGRPKRVPQVLEEAFPVTVDNRPDSRMGE